MANWDQRKIIIAIPEGEGGVVEVDREQLLRLGLAAAR